MGSFMDKAAIFRVDVFICFRPQIYSDVNRIDMNLIGQVIPAAFDAPTALGNTIF